MDWFNELSKKGIPLAPYKIFNNYEEVKDFANKNFPVAVKILSNEHKTDIGGVKLYINSQEELEKAIKDLKKRFNKKMIIQKMIKGVELIVGLKKDEQFGKVILIGIGGIYVEIYKDIAIRVLPIKRKDVEEMMKELKGKKLFENYRGIKINKKKFIDVVLKISKLDIDELDINPLIVNEKNAYVVDVRV